MLHQETTPGRLRVIYKDPANIVGMFHNLHISVSRAELPLEFVHAALEMVAAEAKQQPNGMGLIVVISAEAHPPSGAAREQLAKIHQHLPR